MKTKRFVIGPKTNCGVRAPYERQSEKISRLVASSKSAVVAGGQEVRSSDLTFHYRSDANTEVITWTNHGLAYALMSP